MTNPTWLFVAALYAAAVWLARRGGIDLPKRVALFFYLVVLVFLFKPLTQDYVNIPADVAHTVPPWVSLPHDPVTSNTLMNDIALQIAPWTRQVREAWRSSSLPLWNAMNGAGYPLLGNGQSAALSPLRIATLPLPFGYAMTAEGALKILIALTFTFLLCRRRGYGELPSVVAAVAFGFSTFIHVWLHFPMGTVAAYAPAALYAADLLSERVTFGRFAFASGLWAAMLLGGHPETAAHATFMAVLYAAWIVLIERQQADWRTHLREAFKGLVSIGGAIGAGSLLAMPFLLPFIEAMRRSKRWQELQVHPYDPVVPFSDFPSQVILFQPHFYGRIPHESTWGPAAPESIAGFAGAVGIAACLGLAIRAIAKRRFRDREFFFVVMTLAVLGVILGWPVVSDAFHAIFSIAANARLRLFLCLFLALQTAAALHLAARERSWPFLAGILASAGAMLWLMARMPFPSELAKSVALLAMWPSMVALTVAAIALAAGRWREVAGLFVLVAVVAEMFSAVGGWNPEVPSDLLYPRTPLISKLEQLRAAESRNSPFRITGIGPMFFPNVGAVFGFEDIRAHDPMANGRYLGFLRVRDHYDPSSYFAFWTSFRSHTLDFLNVKYVLAGQGHEPEDRERFREVYSGRDGRIYENLDVLPRFFPARNVLLEFNKPRFARLLASESDLAHTALVNRLSPESDRERLDLLAPRPAGTPEASVRILEARPTSYTLEVSAPRYTLIASSVASWPGWKVEDNGKSLRIEEVNAAFLGFVAPPGRRVVRVYYDPPSFKAGVAAASLALVGMLVVWVRLQRRPLRFWVRRTPAILWRGGVIAVLVAAAIALVFAPMPDTGKRLTPFDYTPVADPRLWLVLEQAEPLMRPHRSVLLLASTLPNEETLYLLAVGALERNWPLAGTYFGVEHSHATDNVDYILVFEGTHRSLDGFRHVADVAWAKLYERKQ